MKTKNKLQQIKKHREQIANKYTEEEIKKAIRIGLNEIKIYSVLHYLDRYNACWKMWDLANEQKDLKMLDILCFTIYHLFIECDYKKRKELLKIKIKKI